MNGQTNLGPVNSTSMQVLHGFVLLLHQIYLHYINPAGSRAHPASWSMFRGGETSQA